MSSYSPQYRSKQAPVAAPRFPQQYPHMLPSGGFAPGHSPKTWTRSMSAGSHTALQGLSVQTGKSGHGRSVSATRSVVYAPRLRSVSAHDISSWHSSSPSPPLASTTAAPVPERYHRAKVSSISLPSLSPSVRSVDVDSFSTQTSESSVGSWREDDKTAAAPSAKSALLAASGLYSTKTSQASTEPDMVYEPFKLPPTLSANQDVSLRTPSISPRSSPVRRLRSESPDKSMLPSNIGSIRAPAIVSPVPSPERRASPPTSYKNLVPSPTKLSIEGPTRSPTTSSASEKPGLILPSDKRNRMSTGIPAPESKSLKPSTSQPPTVVAQAEAQAQPLAQDTAQAKASEAGELRRGSNQRQRRRVSVASIGHTRNPSSDSVTSNQPIDPELWRSSVPVSRQPAAPRGESWDTPRSSSRTSFRESPSFQQLPPQEPPSSRLSAQPSFQTLRQEPHTEPMPAAKRKTSLGGKLKSIFSKRDSKRDNSDAVSVMSGKSGMSSMSVMSTRSIASTFSLSSVKSVGKKLFSKKEPEPVQAGPLNSSAQTSRGAPGGPMAYGAPNLYQSRRQSVAVGDLDYSKPSRRQIPQDFQHRRTSSLSTSRRLSQRYDEPKSTASTPIETLSSSAASLARPATPLHVFGEAPTPPAKVRSEDPPANPELTINEAQSSVSTTPWAGQADSSSNIVPSRGETTDSSTEGEEVIDLATSDTLFPRTLDADGIATIRNSVERVGSIDRKPSQRSVRRRGGADTSADRSEEKVPNATEVAAGSAGQPEMLLDTSVLDFDSSINLSLDFGLSPDFASTLASPAASSVPRPISGISARGNVKFASQIMVFETYSGYDYDRKPEPATCNRLTPMLAQQIKHELNSFKLNMDVHRDSRAYTHFF